LSSGGLGFIEPSISWEVVAFSALLELANGLEAQPATIDATMINNVPRIIQADFLSGDIGTPISRLGVLHDNYEHSTAKKCDAVTGGFRAGRLGIGMSDCGRNRTHFPLLVHRRLLLTSKAIGFEVFFLDSHGAPLRMPRESEGAE
jgi:hypothetical protein